MSTSGNKRRNHKKRAAQGYDPNPPRCANCRDLVPAMLATPGQTTYRAARCNRSGAPVKVVGICDLWTGRDGERLLP